MKINKYFENFNEIYSKIKQKSMKYVNKYQYFKLLIHKKSNNIKYKRYIKDIFYLFTS